MIIIDKLIIFYPLILVVNYKALNTHLKEDTVNMFITIHCKMNYIVDFGNPLSFVMRY